MKTQVVMMLLASTQAIKLRHRQRSALPECAGATVSSGYGVPYTVGHKTFTSAADGAAGNELKAGGSCITSDLRWGPGEPVPSALVQLPECAGATVSSGYGVPNTVGHKTFTSAADGAAGNELKAGGSCITSDLRWGPGEPVPSALVQL